jgi:hypothetical protein
MSLTDVTEAYSAIVRDLALSLAQHEAHSGNTARSSAALPGVRQPLENIRVAFDRWVLQQPLKCTKAWAAWRSLC